jgi:predicted metal-dependent phosphoesterase TrpH
MAVCIDLHLHTDRSDGTLAPSELLNAVRKAHLTAFAVTDHDTLDGCEAVRSLLEPGDPELVMGVELSVDADGADMHMLAYGADPLHEGFCQALERFRRRRNQRGRLMVQKLNELGMDISYQAVREAADGAVLGRPHVAEVMVKLGLVKHFDEAFKKYIGTEGPAYVPKSKLQPARAIDLIHEAGGVAVLAHPYIGEMYRHIETLVPLGLDGLEAYHYSHDRQERRQLKRMATKHKLIITGGSDFHGREGHEGRVGSQDVPADLLEPLKLRIQQIRGNS